MSKRGAAERDYTPSQGNMRKARVEVRRVDAIQVLMAAARARSSAQEQQPQAAAAAAAAATGAGAGQNPAGVATAQAAAVAAAVSNAASPSAPCTHCGTVLLVSADTCSLRQCCACYDVFCSLCSILDYEEREDRVFCLGCLEDQTAASRGNTRGGGGGGSRAAETGPGSATAASLLSLPLSGTAGRWGQLDVYGAVARSPFPCGSRTPQHSGQPGSRTPGSAMYNARSHRGFSALLGYAGAES